MPITSCWGPGLFDPATNGIDMDEALETLQWEKFGATQEGLEAFVSTYRGPSSNYRSANDYSYQMAMTLLSAGYDVLVCRVCPGAKAEYQMKFYKTAGPDADPVATLVIKAKYPGTFGNNLRVSCSKKSSRYLVDGEVKSVNYWNMIVYVLDSAGVKTAVENLSFVFDRENTTDTLYHISEITSNFIDLIYTDDNLTDELGAADESLGCLSDGSDDFATSEAADMLKEAKVYATKRYQKFGENGAGNFVSELGKVTTSNVNKAAAIRYNQFKMYGALEAMEVLTDKLSYNFNRLMFSGWDDQNYSELGENIPDQFDMSASHLRLLDIAYRSRCGCAYIDVPKSLPRSLVWDDSEVTGNVVGYAQRLSRYEPENREADLNANLYSSHCALFAPWAKYTYVGMSKQVEACPSFLALMIERSMILNQSAQYEWALPSSRQHNIKVGKLDYKVPKHLLDNWQSTEGVSLNVITEIPDMGTILWGNSTLYEVPVATYQALANLSTRKLMNAVKDRVFKVGLGITFTYNNSEAMAAFVVGVSPLLDTMKTQGAIEDYKIVMSKDVKAEGRVNYNGIVGKIYLTVNGVINDISIDLVALPSDTDLSTL